MATTLVIKNANFSTNKIETVSFGDHACTDIEINDESYSFTEIGDTQTVDYTVTPSDTTDVIQWSSSNQNVATVEDGVITAVGLGEAIITVTCGSHSDTVPISVAVAFDPSWTVGKQFYDTTSSGGDHYTSSADLTAGAGAGALTGTYSIRYTSNPVVYPYPIPNGVTKIRVVAQDCYIGIVWSKSDEVGYSTYASAKGGNNASSSAGIADDYTYVVPENIDCFALTIRKKSGAAMEQADLVNYTVTFLTT